MSTRSLIGIDHPEEKGMMCVYCHSDGYFKLER